MNTLTGIFPVIDSASLTGLAAMKVALRSDYDDRKHELLFDVFTPEFGDSALVNDEFGVEIEYIGSNSYKTKSKGLVLYGSLNDTRIIVRSLSMTGKTEAFLKSLDEKYPK